MKISKSAIGKWVLRWLLEHGFLTRDDLNFRMRMTYRPYLGGCARQRRKAIRAIKRLYNLELVQG